jgi:Transposase DDE domain
MNKPDCSLDALTRAAAAQQVHISPQGLNKRFTETATVFLKQVIEQAIGTAIQADRCTNWALPRRFPEVYVHDSTQIMLPDTLCSLWRGTGGGIDSDTSSAALKIDLMYGLNAGRTHVHLLPGKHADNRSPLLDVAVAPGSLHLKDLGYFKLERMQEQAAQGQYWLSRLLPGTLTYARADDRQAMDLGDFLQQLKARGITNAERQVWIGAQARLPARLIMVRLSEASAARQRAALKDNARKQGRTSSEKHLALCDWWVLITNVPPDLLSPEEAPNLYGARWQIELMFKLWKSQSRLAVSRSANQWRILCEVYVKLLIVLMQHWILLTGLWEISRRSLTKGVQGIQEQAANLAACIMNRTRLIDCLKGIGSILTSSGCRQNKRKKKPNNWQRLGEIDAVRA